MAFPLAAPLIAAGATLASGLLGGISNSSSNKTNLQMNRETNEANAANVEKTNQMNLQISRETNEFNKQIQDAQNAWNLQQWHRENEYNTPSSQVARLLAAGINPSAVFGNGSMSTASHLEGASLGNAVAPQMEAAQAQPYYQDTSIMPNIISNTLGQYAQARLAFAQAENISNDTQISQFQNERDAEKHLETMKYLRKMSFGKGIENELAREQLALNQSTMQFKVAEAMNNNRLQEQAYKEGNLRMEGIKLANRLQNIQLTFAPSLNNLQVEQMRASLKQINAQVKLILGQSNLTAAQRSSEIEKRVGYIIDNGMKSIDKDTKEAIQSYIVRDYKYGSENKRKEADKWKVGPFEFSRPAQFINHW